MSKKIGFRENVLIGIHLDRGDLSKKKLRIIRTDILPTDSLYAGYSIELGKATGELFHHA